MKFRIYSTGDGCDTREYTDILEKYKLSKMECANGIETIEISTLEELLTLQKELGQDIIVSHDKEMPEIEIYDYYREY